VALGYPDGVGFLDRLRGANAEATEMSVAADTEMLIGVPAEEPPEALVSILREGAAGHREIRAGYLFQMMILAEGEEPHLTLGLDLDDDADVREIGDDLAGRAMQVLPEDASLDVYPLPDDMLRDVAQSVEPFYERGG
jgi:SseB protein C-terminal domain